MLQKEADAYFKIKSCYNVKAETIVMESQDPNSELLEQARIERQQIVEKYDLGREDGAKIDEWEDPKFEVYHKQDRFGFMQ